MERGRERQGEGQREWTVSSRDLFNDISIAVSIAKASHKLTAVRAGKFDWKSGGNKAKGDGEGKAESVTEIELLQCVKLA